MKDFTFLESGFPKWSWSKSNGEASETETLLAFDAISNEGDVYDFSYKVWNDIVDLLNKALDDSGVGWDETYSTVQEAKVTGEFGKLTAKAFNSVRHNISIMNTSWRWIDDKNTKGYVGKLNFNGYDTHGENADLVYGNYILELVEKLNTLISILTDTVNKSLLSSPINSSEFKYEAKLLEGIPNFVVLHEDLTSYITTANLRLNEKIESGATASSAFTHSSFFESNPANETKVNAYGNLSAINSELEAIKNVLENPTLYIEKFLSDAEMKLWAVPLRLDTQKLYIRQSYDITKTKNELEVQ